MKRYFYVLPVLVAIVSIVLVSCGNGKSSKTAAGPTKLTVFAWGFPAEKKAREDEAAAFNAKFPNVQVEMQVSPDYDRKLDAMLASNAGPDVYETSDDWYHLRGKNGQLEDLNPYVKKDKLDINNIFYKKMLEGYILPNGMLEAMPFGMDLFVMAINTDLFKSAGLTLPSNNWTWDEAIADAQKLTTGTGADKIWGMSDLWMYQQIAAFIYGGSYMSPDFKTVVADSPEAIKGVQFIADLMYKYKVMPDPTVSQGLAGQERFFSGKSGMMPVNNWDVDNFESNIGTKFKWDIVKMPTTKETGQSTSWYITEGFGMWSGSKNKDAAWQFIKWATTDPEAAKINARAAVPSTKSAQSIFLGTDTSPNKLNLQVFVDQIDSAHLSPFGGIFGQLGDEFSRAWDAINTKHEDAATAMKAFAKTIRPIIAQMPQ